MVSMKGSQCLDDQRLETQGLSGALGSLLSCESSISKIPLVESISMVKTVLND